MNTLYNPIAFSIGVAKPKHLIKDILGFVEKCLKIESVKEGIITIEFIKDIGPNPIYPGYTSSIDIALRKIKDD